MSTIPPLSDLSTPHSPAGSGASIRAYDDSRLRDDVIDSDWDDWANKLTSQLDQEERYMDLVKYREGIRNQLYYEGNFFWHISEETGQVRSLPHTDNDPFFPHNLFRYFIDLSVAASLDASPDIIIDSANNSDKNRMSARDAGHLGDFLERELITPMFRLDTEKIRELYGGVWWYSYWSMDSNRLFSQSPIYGQKTIELEDSAYICQCGSAGSTEHLFPGFFGPVCPDCKTKNFQVIESPKMTVDEIIGYDRRPLGFPAVECVSPLQMKGDRRGAYMNGQYLRRKRLVDRDVLAHKIPWWDPQRGHGGHGDDPGIDSQERIRRPYGQGSHVMSAGSYDLDRNDVVLEQWWLEPAKYARVSFSRDVHFLGQHKRTIRKGETLGEHFPEGLYLAKAGKDWIDHRPESFKKRWVYIPYIHVPHKADGDSQKDMCEPQREVIHMRSLMYLYLLARGGGAPTIIRSPLSETDFDGNPGTITRLTSGFTGNIAELFHQPQFPPADSSITSYANQMLGEMQTMSQTVSPNSTGDPSAMEMGGTNTARGMMIMDAKAKGLQGPKMIPLAYAQATAVLQWIELFRENIHEDQVPIPLQGKTGSTEWKLLKVANLEGDFIAYPKAGSWMPRPKDERQAAMQNAFTAFGPLLFDPNVPRSIKQEIKEVYQLDFDLDNFDAGIRDVIIHIDKMASYLQDATDMAQSLAMSGMLPPDPETGEMPDPATMVGDILAQMCPPDPDIDDPEVCVWYMREWLRSDIGREADPRLNAGVRALRRQYQQQIQEAQDAEMEKQMQMQERMIQTQAQSQQDTEVAKLEAATQLTLSEKLQEHQNSLELDNRDAHNEMVINASKTDDKIRENAAKIITQAKFMPKPAPAGKSKSIKR
jgi:hypothetical protein